jgi:hypothetical protein
LKLRLKARSRNSYVISGFEIIRWITKIFQTMFLVSQIISSIQTGLSSEHFQTEPASRTTNTGTPSFRLNLLHTLYKTSGHLRLILANKTSSNKL